MSDTDPHAAIEALWRKGILCWKLWDQQIPIYDQIRGLPSDIDEAVILCARQFGKSHLGVLMAVEDCIRYPDRCILIVGPTYEQCRDIVVPRLERIIADAPPGLVRRLKSEKKWLIGDSELVIGGFDANSSSQRGKTVQTIYVEEVVDAHPDHFLTSMRSDLGPALTHSDAGKMIFLTTLPKVPDHPFILENMARAQLNGAYYCYTIDDNQALTPAQREACIRRAGGIHTEDYKREYLCLVIRDRSIVIVPDFSKAIHVRDFVIPPHIKWEVVFDGGGVRDLTAAGLMGYDFLRAVDLVVDELWWPHNTATDHIIRDMRERWGVQLTAAQALAFKRPEPTPEAYFPEQVERVWGDVHGQTRVDMTAAKFTVLPPPKVDWEAALNNLANRFTQNKIEIHPRCKLTIQTCQSGTLNKNRTDFCRSVALGHMDAAAMLMYGVRVLDRTNPYPASAAASSHAMFKRPEPEPVSDVNRPSFAPKTYKTFGRRG